jgi:hypothetical protein
MKSFGNKVLFGMDFSKNFSEVGVFHFKATKILISSTHGTHKLSHHNLQIHKPNESHECFSISKIKNVVST